MATLKDVVSLSTIESEILSRRPTVPMYAIRPKSIERAATWFIKNFQGKILYSVKSNPEPLVLKRLRKAGVDRFDVASLEEIKLIAKLFPRCEKYYMHPVKPRESIRQAYFDYGIRTFSLDSMDELSKILEETEYANDLSLHVRLAISNTKSAIDLSGKFGILPTDSSGLIKAARNAAKTFGICFHVGSQCMDPAEYLNATSIVAQLIKQTGIKLDVLDIGGGFPSSYPGMTPPALSVYIRVVNECKQLLQLGDSCEFWCEPGRALVAESGSLLVRVEARKKNMLYLNDGTYGGLFDAGFPGFIYPSKAMRVNKKEALATNNIPFGFYGPTCDSLDSMKGPFYLPENIAEGDYIEIGQLGAYSRSIRTEFNGFKESILVEVSDEPLISMYRDL